ncbi:MAG: hypothetical protein ABI921_06110 [Panacibacter sp.]
MKKITLYTIFCYAIFCSCTGNEPQKIIHFKPLNAGVFNFSGDSSLKIPKGKFMEERKRMHDSCMGESFAANAIFIKTKDTIRPGAIVNMKTMKVVKNFDILPRQLFGDILTFMTKPCYEKSQLDLSPTSFINEKITLIIPGAGEATNNELNQALNNSIYTEIETGAWLNIELTDAFGKLLDTTTNDHLLEYKKYLLDTANMVLIKSSSITDVSFYITVPKPMSKQLQQELVNKPQASIGNSNLKVQLFFISANSMQVRFSGNFQMMGQFMQCKLE